MSESSRRDALRIIAAAALSGSLEAQQAEHVHKAAAEQAKPAGIYKPQCFTADEFASLKTLCELIVPGATKGGAAEFIDTLASQNKELAAIFTGGLSWLDHEMLRNDRPAFRTAKPDDQRAMVDKIAYRRNQTPDLAAGVRFFDWARRLTVDAYYTSKAGIEEIGYKGNRGMSEFNVPREALEYALKKSGLG
jgi:hypothetical protein